MRGRACHTDLAGSAQRWVGGTLLLLLLLVVVVVFTVSVCVLRVCAFIFIAIILPSVRGTAGTYAHNVHM